MIFFCTDHRRCRMDSDAASKPDAKIKRQLIQTGERCKYLPDTRVFKALP